MVGSRRLARLQVWRDCLLPVTRSPMAPTSNPGSTTTAEFASSDGTYVRSMPSCAGPKPVTAGGPRILLASQGPIRLRHLAAFSKEMAGEGLLESRLALSRACRRSGRRWRRPAATRARSPRHSSSKKPSVGSIELFSSLGIDLMVIVDNAGALCDHQGFLDRVQPLIDVRVAIVDGAACRCPAEPCGLPSRVVA